MDRAQAIAEIEAIFGQYKTLVPADQALLQALDKGKLYELYVLAELVDHLAQRGFVFVFVGTSLQFKAAPGQIKLSDPHFELHAVGHSVHYLFVDIEFRTLGSTQQAVGDYSGYHEVDLIVVDRPRPHPLPHEIAFAVECKCVAKFGKKLIKEALGVRRELAFVQSAQPSILSQVSGPTVMVCAEPPSEFWLAHIDPAGGGYGQSPVAFGIEVRHIEP